MTRLMAVGLLGLAALAAITGPASAQSSMTWAGSLYGGYAKMMEDKDVAVVPSGSFGVRGNLFAMVDPVLGIGAEVGYHALGSEDFSDPLLGDGEVKYNAIQATAQAIARGVRGSVRPYGTLGLGLYALKGKVDLGGTETSDTESKFGVNLGGGVQFKSEGSNIGFGIEGKWHSVFKGWVNSDGEEASLDVVTVMAGINFK